MNWSLDNCSELFMVSASRAHCLATLKVACSSLAALPLETPFWIEFGSVLVPPTIEVFFLHCW